MNRNPHIRSLLSDEFSKLQEIPQDGNLERAANDVLKELKIHGVRERADRPLLDLPLHLKVQFIVDVLQTVPDEQFEKLIQINGRIDWALDALTKRLQVLRVAAVPTSSTTPIWRSRLSEY